MNRIHHVPLHISGGLLSDERTPQVHLPVPMVYETVPDEPLRWEYRTLAIDSREQDLPSVTELNELGSQGWILVGVLNTEKHVVHYYFVRQQRMSA